MWMCSPVQMTHHQVQSGSDAQTEHAWSMLINNSPYCESDDDVPCVKSPSIGCKVWPGLPRGPYNPAVSLQPPDELLASVLLWHRHACSIARSARQ